MADHALKYLSLSGIRASTDWMHMDRLTVLPNIVDYQCQCRRECVRNQRRPAVYRALRKALTPTRHRVAIQDEQIVD
jgi:hypothetical protein